tara:strand:- start:534 stop:824 length:291 start_codon:yes stop_codon:yes gene_type:complete
MYPKNRHLLVEPVDSEESQTLVALPEEYLPAKEHQIVKILKISTDCQMFVDEGNLRYPSDVGSTLIVPGNMLISFTYQGSKHYLVQENYVLAQITE